MVYSVWDVMAKYAPSSAYANPGSVQVGDLSGRLLYSHIVIDILKGTCEIMDPHADAQMDCIYFEVCN